jgi:hypothetical protein
MPETHKPTREECRIIRACAERDAQKSRVIIEPGERFNRMTGNVALNLALISTDPEWNDTDLHDHKSWSHFQRGFPLAEGGRAIVDFYVYSVRGLNEVDELETNVTAYWEGGVLVRVDGTGEKARGMWARVEDVQDA